MSRWMILFLLPAVVGYLIFLLLSVFSLFAAHLVRKRVRHIQATGLLPARYQWLTIAPQDVKIKDTPGNRRLLQITVLISYLWQGIAYLLAFTGTGFIFYV